MENLFTSFVVYCFLLLTSNLTNPATYYNKFYLTKKVLQSIEIKESPNFSFSFNVLEAQTKLIQKKSVSYIEMGNTVEQNPKSQLHAYIYFIYVKDFNCQNKNAWYEMLRYAESKPYEYSTDVYFYGGKLFESKKINLNVIKNYGYPKYDKFIVASYFHHDCGQVIAFKRFPKNREYFAGDGNWPYKDAVNIKSKSCQ